MTRTDVLLDPDVTETFTYDAVDRLKTVSGPYSQNYEYSTVGNITSVTTNETTSTYTYPTNGVRPHAVTGITNPSTSYTYDANGNMTTKGSQTITWNVDNMVSQITDGSNTSTFVYDGDGNRVKKTENNETILYINQFYEKNITTSVVTTSYYLGGKLIAQREGETLKYIHQDSLGSSSVMSDSSGTSLSSIAYFPFGATRSGSISTDKQFTGQRFDDSTGLYYYGARYYDATIGRFISPDTIVQNPANPQTLNRYSYCLNNPLKYIDPTGHYVGAPPEFCGQEFSFVYSYKFSANYYCLYSFEFYCAMYRYLCSTYDINPTGESGQALVGVVLTLFPTLELPRVLDDSMNFWEQAYSVFMYPGRAFEDLRSKTSNAIKDELSKTQTGRNIDNGINTFGQFLNDYSAVLSLAFPGDAGAIDDAFTNIKNWIGKGGRIITNEADDIILISADGTRKVRFDINRPDPHLSPHANIEELINGKWVKSGPIYPYDVPQK